MSIGSVYYFDYKLTSAMAEMVEAWENSLETNHDDFVVVDNEEGDYGIIRYMDTNGVEMLTKVVQGGDIENTYFTAAGVVAMRKMMQDNFNDMLEAALTAGLPTEGDLKAHVQPEISVIDLNRRELPEKFGRFDLVLFDDNYFTPFHDPEIPGHYLLWCDPEHEYMRAGTDLYATIETWNACLRAGIVTAGVHKKGLYDLIQCFHGGKQNEH
ncbi:MAG: hypothetical protein WC052_05835 [Patescibacteria group bacterium]